MSKDKCVLCGKETIYDESTHIELRNGYVVGVGQTCPNGCKDEDFIKVPKEIIKEYSNYYELGNYVRKLYNETIK